MAGSFIVDDEIRRFAQTLPSCWREDYKLGVARSALATNKAYEAGAYDAAGGLNSGNFLNGNYGGRNTMPDPMLTKYSNDQYNFNMIQGIKTYLEEQGVAPEIFTRLDDFISSGAADQLDQLSPADLLDLIETCLGHFQEDRQQMREFAEGLSDLLESQTGAADQLYERRPRGNTGTALHHMTPNGRTRGTFSGRYHPDNGRTAIGTRSQNDRWNERAIDQLPPLAEPPVGPRPPGDRTSRGGRRSRKPAQDRALATACQQRQTSAFLKRFPMAAAVKFSANGRY